jgi:hypothetical protein
MAICSKLALKELSMSIEDIILDRDRRGISKLRPYLPGNFVDDAAQLILDNPGTAVIVTGFYILTAGAAETDGPPGAIVIGNALQKLGYEVVYVTDKYAASLISSIVGDKARVIDFPITDDAASKKFAQDLMKELAPSVLISIERCGFTEEGDFRNMRGLDITAYNARIDHMFTDFPVSVGIGDGGNEIGMGNLAKEVPTVDSLVKLPCVTKVTRLVLGSVSNWGGYGLVAGLSKLSGKNLMPGIEEDREIITKTVDFGAVDGMSGVQEYKVDGFTLEENSETVKQLHDYLAKQGIKS